MAVTLETEDLVIGRGWLIAHYPRVECAYFGPNVDDRSFDDYIERFTADIHRRPKDEKIGVLYYAQDADMDSPRRRRMAKVLKEHEQILAQTTGAYALATGSPFVRGVLTTLFWLAPPGYPYKVVSSPRQGFSFIAEHVPGIDTEALTGKFTELLDTRMHKKAS
ncbi:MAG: hypothetical protein R6X02_11805 [Enhygromyxa sp.]